MKSKKLLLAIISLILVSSCSKEAGKTPAQVSLRLAGITNASNGYGAGGTILFGKSTTGEQFGKILNGTEENLDLTNGQWTFYAFMWKKNSSNFDGAVSCAKTSTLLTGAAASISLKLSNNNCDDVEISGSDIYSMAGVKKFADFVVEECDELNKANGFTCLRDNQGSALSYRMAFKSYKKSPGGAPQFTNETLYSQCMKSSTAPNMLNDAMNFNFPASNSGMPFVVSVEMFLGSSDCAESVAEKKGMVVQTFSQGIGAGSSSENTIVKSPSSVCSGAIATKEICESYRGVFSTGCLFNGPATGAFIPASACGGTPITLTSKYIKQMISIPKSTLCKNSNYLLEGEDAFAGGDGTIDRPYKICNEWQMNQIGEVSLASANFNSKSFKLMNDLDMNVTDFNNSLKPTCAHPSGSILGKHHNLNPIGKIANGSCSAVLPESAATYTGTFNGNNKLISNARIIAEDVDSIGFVRALGAGGMIKNLRFKNLEVRGNNYVGGLAGTASLTSEISNVRINEGEVEAANEFAGSVAGQSAGYTVDVEVRDMRLHAKNYLGGIIGRSSGLVFTSMFRGDIKQHVSSTSYVGGLVGYNMNAATVQYSFSEGSIESSSEYTGGVIGKNMGMVKDSYSNMYISSNYPNSSVKLGGVIGYNSATPTWVEGIYSDGVIRYNGGGATPLIDQISNGDAINNSQCFGPSESGITTSNSGCAQVNLRSGTSLFSGSNQWIYTVNSLPRLQWESSQRPCAEGNASSIVISYQNSVLNRGSASNPYIVCTAAQLKELDGAPNSVYFSLAEDITLRSWQAADFINAFSGTLDGKGYGLSGLDVTSSGSFNHGLFRNNTGVIKNLKLFGNKITHTSGTGATAVLAGVNSGSIKNVELTGAQVEGSNYVGAVTGQNTGMIDSVTVRSSLIKGAMFVGGIAGTSNNNGSVISRVSANVRLLPFGSLYETFGGIVGYNGAGTLLEQAVFSGTMDFITASTASTLNTGGLAGTNLGVIQDSMTKNYASIRVSNSTRVGGLVGSNDSTGIIRRSFGLGSVIFLNSSVPGGAFFGALYGQNSGFVDTNSYYLEKNVGAYLGSPTTDTECSGGFVNFTSIYPSYMSSGAIELLIAPTGNSSGDSLRNFEFIPLVSTAHMIPYSAACASGTTFQVLKSYEQDTFGKRSIATLGSVSAYTNYDLAYDSEGNGVDRNLERLLEFYKAGMEGRSPALTPPVWEFEYGEAHPRLLQVND